MVFVYPLFLWALAALAVPVIIHLFNFRRYKKVYFTNVKFLKELQLESKSRSRLREILVLVLRCLALACLVLAFCQPVLIDGAAKTLPRGSKAISIYIDNSFSMENINKQGPLFDIAKQRAKEIVNAFGTADKFQIITNDFEGRHQRFNTRDNALSVIEELKISSASRKISDVVKRQREFLNGSSLVTKKVYLLSDAQKSTFDLNNLQDDTTIKTTIIPFPANRVNNAYVDSCWFESPLQQKGFIQKLHATIVNNGNTSIEAGSAKLFLNKQQIALASFSLDANSKNEVLFTFECKNQGLNYGSIKIEDYPVTFDDELFFAFNSKINIAVTLVNGKAQEASNSLTSLFKSDSLFKFNVFAEQAIDYNFFKTSNVIVLNQLSEISSGLLSELIKFSGQGGALVMIPPSGVNPAFYNPALSALGLPAIGTDDSTAIKTEKIATGSSFYTGVFEKIEERINLPLVNRHYRLVKNNRSGFETVLSLQNADPLFGFSRLKNALVYFFTAPLNESATNFNKHALFVPTFYQVCFNSVRFTPLFYTIGNSTIINLKNTVNVAEQPPHVKKLNGEVDIIPEIRTINNSLFLYTREQVNEPGFYEISRGADTLLPVAFNYSRSESLLDVFTAGELETALVSEGLSSFSLIEDNGGDISGQVLAGAEGKKLWKLFIILTLLMVAIETMVLRFLK